MRRRRLGLILLAVYSLAIGALYALHPTHHPTGLQFVGSLVAVSLFLMSSLAGTTVVEGCFVVGGQVILVALTFAVNPSHLAAVSHHPFLAVLPKVLAAELAIAVAASFPFRRVF